MAKKSAVVPVLAGVVLVALWLALRKAPHEPAQPAPALPMSPTRPAEPASAGTPSAGQREPSTGDGEAWRGQVVDEHGAGIAGVEVTAEGPLDAPEGERTALGTRSGADGAFEFTGLPPGHYDLVAEPGPDVAHEPDAPWLETHLSDASRAAPARIVLTRGAVIRGRTLGGRHQPLAGYVVVGLGAEGGTTWTSTTDAEGRFELVVPPGTLWDVQVSLPPAGATSASENTQYTERKVRAGTKDLVLQFVPMLPPGG